MTDSEKKKNPFLEIQPKYSLGVHFRNIGIVENSVQQFSTTHTHIPPSLSLLPTECICSQAQRANNSLENLA